MIKVAKTETAPPELQQKGYGCDEVKRQLLTDQKEKCYLCERKLTTDYQVEHLVSRHGNDALSNEWSNLFLSCGYCNDRKKHNYDDIPSPDSQNFEDLIEQRIDYSKGTATFTCMTQDEALTKLVKLLTVLFNGKDPRRRNLMENRFWKEIYEDYDSFIRHLGDYLQNRNPETRQLVVDSLDITQPNLGFKYRYLRDNPKLWEEFGDLCGWNK